MALDESLLEDSSSCWLRFYSWEPFAVSLGYFQKHVDFAAEGSEFDLVRRPTGGGAILHAHELTFSLALPESALRGSTRESYGLINRGLLAALGTLDIHLEKPQDCRAGSGRWCFAHPVGLDLVQADGRKVIGCAQRRSHGRVLHHGSLILEQHPRTPFTGSLRECGLDPAMPLVDRLSESLARTLCLRKREIERPPEKLLARALELEKERYGSEAWTRRR